MPRVECDGGRLEIAWDVVAHSGPISAVCRWPDGGTDVSDQWQADDGAFTTRCGPFELHLTVQRESTARARIQLSVPNAGAAEGPESIGLVLSPRIHSRPPTRMVYSGFQSWDSADIALHAASHPSWWISALADQAGAGVAVAAVSGDHWATRISVTEDGSWSLLQAPAPRPGPKPRLWAAGAAGWHAEPIVLAAADDVWGALANVAAAAAEARSGPVEKPTPVGWLSWYRFGAWVTEEDVEAMSALLAEPRWARLGYRHVQIDDGWQQAYGDWVPNTKFRDWSGLASRIGGRGQQPGVWTAPFLVSASAELATSAPEHWFLRDTEDPTGSARLIDPVHTSFGPQYVLDGGVPEVRQHLEATFRRLRCDGFTYFKIDFLYAGAYGGLGALRSGVAAIRSGVGEDAYILACGAPLLPLQGMVDGCRVGQDTATPLYDFETGQPMVRIFGDEVLWVSRNIVSRHFMRPWFQLDGDVALVGANLTFGQARQLVTAVALSGGLFFASDDLRQLEEARLELLRNTEILGLIGGPPPVPDWALESEPAQASIWRRDDILAAFNWVGPHRQLTVEIPPGVTVHDLWQQRELAVDPAGERILIDLETSGVVVLRLEGARKVSAWLA